MSADDKKAPSMEFVPNESHYHSKKDRTFVRAIAGPGHRRVADVPQLQMAADAEQAKLLTPHHLPDPA